MTKAISSTVMLVTLMLSSSAFACSCAFPSSPKQHVETAKVMFEGVATSIKFKGRVPETEFQITRAYRGVAPDQEKIRVKQFGGLCNYGFAEG